MSTWCVGAQGAQGGHPPPPSRHIKPTLGEHGALIQFCVINSVRRERSEGFDAR